MFSEKIDFSGMSTEQIERALAKMMKDYEQSVNYGGHAEEISSRLPIDRMLSGNEELDQLGEKSYETMLTWLGVGGDNYDEFSNTHNNDLSRRFAQITNHLDRFEDETAARIIRDVVELTSEDPQFSVDLHQEQRIAGDDSVESVSDLVSKEGRELLISDVITYLNQISESNIEDKVGMSYSDIIDHFLDQTDRADLVVNPIKKIIPSDQYYQDPSEEMIGRPYKVRDVYNPTVSVDDPDRRGADHREIEGVESSDNYLQHFSNLDPELADKLAQAGYSIEVLQVQDSFANSDEIDYEEIMRQSIENESYRELLEFLQDSDMDPEVVKDIEKEVIDHIGATDAIEIIGLFSHPEDVGQKAIKKLASIGEESDRLDISHTANKLDIILDILEHKALEVSPEEEIIKSLKETADEKLKEVRNMKEEL